MSQVTLNDWTGKKPLEAEPSLGQRHGRPCEFCSRRVVLAKDEKGFLRVVEFKNGGPWFLKEKDGELHLSWWGHSKADYKVHRCKGLDRHIQERSLRAMARKFTNPEEYELEDIDPRAEEL